MVTHTFPLVHVQPVLVVVFLPLPTAVVRTAPVALGLSFPFFLFVVGFALVAVQ